MNEQWPRLERLVRQLRDILLAEFGCEDAWVVRTGGRCRLEVRVQGRQRLLLDDTEEHFWARFYTPLERERVSFGERVVYVQQWRKPAAELVAVLTPYWRQAEGTVSSSSGQRPLP